MEGREESTPEAFLRDNTSLFKDGGPRPLLTTASWPLFPTPRPLLPDPEAEYSGRSRFFWGSTESEVCS